MANIYHLTNLFSNGNFSIRPGGLNNTQDYNFKYFSEDTPYMPLSFVKNDKEIMPVTFNLLSGGWRRSTYYLTMLRKTKSYSSNRIVEVQTQSNNRFAVGSGMMFNFRERLGAASDPIFMVVIPHHIYHEAKTQPHPFPWVVNNRKQHIEVFLHNNIRHVNQTLWNYIRTCYIELLELEGLRFSFKDPNQIWDLTTVSYQKPKFNSMKELKAFKDDINEEIQLINFT